jgi:hypothetical protein
MQTNFFIGKNAQIEGGFIVLSTRPHLELLAYPPELTPVIYTAMWQAHIDEADEQIIYNFIEAEREEDTPASTAKLIMRLLSTTFLSSSMGGPLNTSSCLKILSVLFTMETATGFARKGLKNIPGKQRRSSTGQKTTPGMPLYGRTCKGTANACRFISIR